MPQAQTWIFIGDGSKARLFQSTMQAARLRLIDEWSSEDARKFDRDLSRDRPVRGRTIGTGEPFVVERVSEHDKAEAAFIEECAVRLEKAASAKAFKRLVLAAAPKALGLLRKSLGPEARALVVASLDKDLTNVPEQDLPGYFSKHLERI